MMRVLLGALAVVYAAHDVVDDLAVTVGDASAVKVLSAAQKEREFKKSDPYAAMAMEAGNVKQTAFVDPWRRHHKKALVQHKQVQQHQKVGFADVDNLLKRFGRK